MDYKAFLGLIKKNDLEPAYLFTGDEEYLIIDLIEKLKDRYIGDSFETLNYINIDGKDKGFDHILNACETLPFMAEKKLVVVKDLAEIMENDDNNFDEKLSNYIKELGDYLYLILIDKSKTFKKSTKVYKTMKKLDRVVEFNKLRGRDLSLWIEKKLKEYNKTISNSDLNYFIQKSTYSEYGSTKTLYDLENEIFKIANHTLDHEVTKEDINLVLTKPLDTNIFNLLNSINKKDSDLALKIFNEMYISNEPIQRILFMITRQLRLMLGYKLYKEKGYTEGDIREKLEIKPYEFKKIASQSRNYTSDQLKSSLEYTLAIDEKQRASSQDSKLAIEILIVNLSHCI